MELTVPTEVVLVDLVNTPIQVYFETDGNTVQFEYVVSTLDITSTNNILAVEFDSTADIPISLVEVLRGPPGPTGTYEDELMYSKRVDFVTDDLLYRAEAAVGANESSAVWRIRRIAFGVDGDVTETWASSTAEFDKQWTLRATYIYS